MTNQKDAELHASMVQLARDDRFRMFMGAVAELRESALAEACANENVANHAVIASYMGEVRAYRDLEAIYNEALKVRVEEKQGVD